MINDLSLSGEFGKIAKEFEKLKGACIKLLYRAEYIQTIQRIKDKMFALLAEEKQLWESYIDHNDGIHMKALN